MQRIQSFLQAVVQSWNSGRSGKIVVGAGAALVLCLGCGLCGAVQNAVNPNAQQERVAAQATADAARPTATPKPTNTPRPPTATPEPTNTPRPKPTATPTSPPAPTATPLVAGIPGLHPADIKVNVQERFALECGDIEEGATHYVWTCKRTTDVAELVVTFYARSLNTVDFVNASAIQFVEPTLDVAGTFLGYIATMPYDNADPDAARSWVEETLPTLKGQGDFRTAEFGGVPFELFGIPTAFDLQYGTLE